MPVPHVTHSNPSRINEANRIAEPTIIHLYELAKLTRHPPQITEALPDLLL